MKTKPKSDDNLRKEAIVALNTLEQAVEAADISTQEGVNGLMNLLREVQAHASEVEFLARKGYAIMRRAVAKIELPANTAMSLADFQKEVKRQRQAYVAPMKAVVDADYKLHAELMQLGDVIGKLLNRAAHKGFQPTN